MFREISPDQKEEARRLIDEGKLSLDEIAERVGISEPTVRRMLAPQNPQPPEPPEEKPDDGKPVIVPIEEFLKFEFDVETLPRKYNITTPQGLILFQTFKRAYKLGEIADRLLRKCKDELDDPTRIAVDIANRTAKTYSDLFIYLKDKNTGFNLLLRMDHDDGGVEKVPK